LLHHPKVARNPAWETTLYYRHCYIWQAVISGLWLTFDSLEAGPTGHGEPIYPGGVIGHVWRAF